WVRFESEGYPSQGELPDYRKIPVSYAGTFSGPFGSGIENAPIPLAIIGKLAGKKWTVREIRQSVSEIDSLARRIQKTGSLSTDASNLILLLQGKIYERYACNSIVGTISASSLVGLLNAVRARILELTIQLEKSIPASAEIGLGPIT